MFLLFIIVSLNIGPSVYMDMHSHSHSHAHIYDYAYAIVDMNVAYIHNDGYNTVVFWFQYFNKLRQNIISSQPMEKQEIMAQYFQHLMEGIERSLLSKNRDL